LFISSFGLDEFDIEVFSLCHLHFKVRIVSFNIALINIISVFIVCSFLVSGDV